MPDNLIAQRPLRSVLYVPGDNERAMLKAPALPVDAVIYDLEDAVAPNNKQVARKRVCRAVSERDSCSCFTAIRINHPSTSIGADDLQAAIAAGPDALVLPKVEDAQELADLTSRIEAHEEAGTSMQIWAMMETPRAILNVREIAELSQSSLPQLGALVLGINDLGKQTGVSPELMAPWLMECVLAAKAFDLSIIDGVYNDFKDTNGLQNECERGRRMGFNGKTLIHPSQIEIANKEFSPSEEQLQQAAELKALFEREGHEDVNVLQLNGAMVERLHYEMALKTLKIAEMIQESRDEI